MKAVNLLPSDQRASSKATPAAKSTAQPGGSFGAFAVLGVLAFAVVASAAYVLTTNTIKDRQTELARVQAETKATQAKAAALAPYAEFAMLAANRVTTVKSLAESRFEWDRALHDISRSLPADVRLKSIKGSTNTQSGNGGSSLRGAIQAPAVELAGCTTTQSGVARMMSRLRTVRGVTRVTLAKSDKDATGVMTPAAASAGGTGEQLCPKGAPPAFEVIVFFERAATPAVSAPGAAGQTAPQAGTQPQSGQAPQSGQTTQPAQPQAGAGTTQTAPGSAPVPQEVSSK
jgi:Tfp pilus assembly protein PilN